MSDLRLEDDIPLSFEEWAEFSARLQKTAPEERGQLLEEHDLVDAWGRCELHYGTLIANDLRAGRMERAQLYAALFTPEGGAR
jgi:hypothetical protein